MSSVDSQVAASAASHFPRQLGPRRALAAALVAAVVAAIAFLPPLVALWLVFGGALFTLVLLLPVTGLYLLPFGVGFGSLVSVQVHGVNVGPTDLIVVALVLAGVVRVVSHAPGEPRVWLHVASAPHLVMSLRALARRDPLRFALYATLLAYLVVVTLSLTVATDPVPTLKEVVKWGEVAVLVPIAYELFPNPVRVRLLAWCMIAAGTLQALTGLWQWASLNSEASTGRIWGTFNQPNPFAGYLNFALMLSVALMLFSVDWRERWMTGAASVLIAGAEVVARSRGAAVGIAAGLLVIIVVGWRRERLLAWVVGIGLPVAVIAWFTHLVPLSLQQRLLDQINLDDAALCNHLSNANYSIVARLAYWKSGMRMFATHPVLGVGAGNFNAAYAPYAIWCWPDPLGHAHNYYINAAAETGILGLVAFLALTGISFALGWRASHQIDEALGQQQGTERNSLGGAVVSRTERFVSALGAGLSPLLTKGIALRALALGFFGVVIAVAAQNLTDDLFVHAMELQFALCLAALLRLGVLSRGSG